MDTLALGVPAVGPGIDEVGPCGLPLLQQLHPVSACDVPTAAAGLPRRGYLSPQRGRVEGNVEQGEANWCGGRARLRLPSTEHVQLLRAGIHEVDFFRKWSNRPAARGTFNERRRAMRRPGRTRRRPRETLEQPGSAAAAGATPPRRPALRR